MTQAPFTAKPTREDLTQVLVVEDDLDAGDALCRLLDRHGCQTRCARSLSEAQALLDPPPDWMILDLTLPDGDGLSLLHYVHDNSLPIRVAVITGTSDPIRLWEATKLHPTMLIRKPVDPIDIIRRMR